MKQGAYNIWETGGVHAPCLQTSEGSANGAPKLATAVEHAGKRHCVHIIDISADHATGYVELSATRYARYVTSALPLAAHARAMKWLSRGMLAGRGQ
jgi:hypothetical protein